jgi:hypothetical protein
MDETVKQRLFLLRLLPGPAHDYQSRGQDLQVLRRPAEGTHAGFDVRIEATAAFNVRG